MLMYRRADRLPAKLQVYRRVKILCRSTWEEESPILGVEIATPC